MSIGYRAIEAIREFEDEVAKFGLKLARPRHSSPYDQFALVPKDSESLPIYNRDAELFLGNLDQARCWLRGVQWLHQYYQMLDLVDDKKIQRKEQNERNRQLMSKLKNSGDSK